MGGKSPGAGNRLVDAFKCSLVTMMIAFKTRINSLKSMYCTYGNKLVMIFIHYLAALNNDCCRFRSPTEQTPFSALTKIFIRWLIIINPRSLTSIKGTLALVPRVSLACARLSESRVGTYFNKQSENKTRATWEKGGGGGKNTLSLPSPCAFFAYLYTPFYCTTFHHYLGAWNRLGYPLNRGYTTSTSLQ